MNFQDYFQKSNYLGRYLLVIGYFLAVFHNFVVWNLISINNENLFERDEIINLRHSGYWWNAVCFWRLFKSEKLIGVEILINPYSKNKFCCGEFQYISFIFDIHTGNVGATTMILEVKLVSRVIILCCVNCIKGDINKYLVRFLMLEFKILGIIFVIL